jgi:hypothetical protein
MPSIATPAGDNGAMLGAAAEGAPFEPPAPPEVIGRRSAAHVAEALP